MSNFVWNAKLADEALKLAGQGLQSATIFFKNAVKETLSVPAPRVRLVDRKGAAYYRAGYKLNDPARMVTPYIKGAREANETTFKFPGGKQTGPPKPVSFKYQTAPAIKGDPPRKLSGNLRRNILHEFLDPMQLFEGGTMPTRGRIGTNIKYARHLEYHKNKHSFMDRTYQKFRLDLERIVANTI